MLRIKSKFYLRKSSGLYIVVEKLTDKDEYITRFTINESGALLWNTLINGTDKETLLVVIQDEYDVKADEAMHDINTFLDMLREKQVLEE